MLSQDAIMDLAFALGLPSHQLVVGIHTFGTLYRLANTSQTTPGSASISWSANRQPITTISHSKVASYFMKERKLIKIVLLSRFVMCERRQTGL